MTDLTSQQCANLDSDESPFNSEQTSNCLKQLIPQWQLNEQEQSISHSYSFKNYYQTMAFVNVVAQVAHQQNHHPELTVSYNCCIITYSTHSVGGLSINDFICAAKINATQNI